MAPIKTPMAKDVVMSSVVVFSTGCPASVRRTTRGVGVPGIATGGSTVSS